MSLRSKLDIHKTQFLVDTLSDGSQLLRKFRRKHKLMLFRDGIPVKPITTEEWNEMWSKHRNIVMLEKLSTDWVWQLVEIP